MPALTATRAGADRRRRRSPRSRSRARFSCSTSTSSRARRTSAIRLRARCRRISTTAIPLNDFPYLLSWGVLVKSWRIVTGDRTRAIPNGRRCAVVVGRRKAIRARRGREAARPAQSQRAVPAAAARAAGDAGELSPQPAAALHRASADRIRARLAAVLDRRVGRLRPARATRRVARLQALGVRDDAGPAERPRRRPPGRGGDHARPRPLHRPLSFRAARSTNGWSSEACGERYRVRADNVDSLDRDLRRQALAFDPARSAPTDPGATPPAAISQGPAIGTAPMEGLQF